MSKSRHRFCGFIRRYRIMKKSSEEWLQELYPEYEVLDPDGWDRTHGQEAFDMSWNELITKDEFNRRFCMSTVGPSYKVRFKNKNDDIVL